MDILPKFKTRKILLVFFSFLMLLLLPGTAFAYTTSMSASVVVGQSSFTTSSTGTSETTLNGPRGVAVCNGKLIVAELTNNRVLVWNAIPTSNGQAADVVIGQPNFTSNTANNGGISAATLSGPFAVACAGGKLFIADSLNNRVLIYNSIPTSNGASANVVVGQSSMTTNTAQDGNALNGLEKPEGVTSDGSKLIILDSLNQRALIFNSIPTSNGAFANVAQGTSHGEGCNAIGLSGEPIGIYTDGQKMFISLTFPSGANRVLVWNSIPTVNNTPADVVIGQPDFTTCTANTGGIGANTLDRPFGVFKDPTGRLFIGDRGSHRVLIYNSVPGSNNASANLVIGQPNFTSNSVNQGGAPGANTLSGAPYIAATDNQIFVSDSANNRILIYNDDQPPPGPVIGAFNPNCLPFFKYCTQGGMNYQGTLQAITGGVDSPQEKVLLSENSTIHDVYITINKVETSDLLEANIPFPWMQGYSTVSEIYNFQLLSAFNGYPLPAFLNPVTVILSYDPTKLGGMSPNSLRIGYFNPSTRRWSVLQNNTVVNPITHEIANTTKTLGYFSVVYPRP